MVALAVRLAGGEPRAVTARDEDAEFQVQGIVLGGGQDVFPMLYDDTPQQGYAYNRPRDELDMRLARLASEKNLPLLGICRGAQLLNVVRGGSLHVDVSEAYEDADYPDSLFAKAFYRKKILTKAGSIIRAALGGPEARVNSLHKQSVKRLGDGLEVSAEEPNGVVQAIEDTSLQYFMGVQFHPELMLHRSMFRQIFALLVEAAANTAPVIIGPEKSAV